MHPDIKAVDVPQLRIIFFDPVKDGTVGCAIHFESHFHDLITPFDSAYVRPAAGSDVSGEGEELSNLGDCVGSAGVLDSKGRTLSRATVGWPGVEETRDATDGVTNGRLWARPLNFDKTTCW